MVASKEGVLARRVRRHRAAVEVLVRRVGALVRTVSKALVNNAAASKVGVLARRASRRVVVEVLVRKVGALVWTVSEALVNKVVVLVSAVSKMLVNKVGA